jgi:hypothetical protein
VREELEALLREVAFGADPNLTPDHRLRAAEQLRGMGAGDTAYSFERELADLDDGEIQKMTDALNASLLVCSGDDELRERWPETATVLERMIEERLQQRLRSDAKLDGHRC